MKIKIAIVDDHKLFRDGISSLIEKYEDMEVIGEVANEEELMSLLAVDIPHVILMDISLGQQNGLEILKVIKEKFPKAKTIILTMHEEGQYVVKAVRNGAYSYLLKNTDEVELIHAIKTVANGKKYYNQDISELMIGNIALEGTEEKKLSKRETEILIMVAKGKTTKEIALELCVSNRTVETHRFNMMKKLNVQNTAELINKAVNLGYVS